MYSGEAADELSHLDSEKLLELGVTLLKQDKFPDAVLCSEELNWLFNIEAVTSHGPVTVKRVRELARAPENCLATRLYVTAFPGLRQFKRHFDTNTGIQRSGSPNFQTT